MSRQCERNGTPVVSNILLRKEEGRGHIDGYSYHESVNS